MGALSTHDMEKIVVAVITIVTTLYKELGPRVVVRQCWRLQGRVVYPP